MSIHLLIWLLKFCLLIQKTYSFKPPKHDLAFYFKTHASVSVNYPLNHTTSYGIYVAGKTTTINIPKNVANMSEILDWKVVNTNENQLMFVHNKKAQILIERQQIKQMDYSGELSDSIIAFGYNEALHVPTIASPLPSEPARKWNYIELLHFDDKNEKVSVIRSLPWLKDDWKWIREWKMMDYIHFDDKLYLAIHRAISKANSKAVIQEISIIRLCLDKGIELISSAVEIRFTKPEFRTVKVVAAKFFLILAPSDHENKDFHLYTEQYISPLSLPSQTTYSLINFVPLFDETANDCASGFGNITLMRHHLTSEDGECKKTSYKSCSTNENIVPSRDGSQMLLPSITFLAQFNLQQVAFHKVQFLSLPYPHFINHLLRHAISVINTTVCSYTISSIACNPFDKSSLIYNSSTEFYINKNPFGFNYIAKQNKGLFFLPIEMCSHLKTCTQCIMYGLYYNCIWSNLICFHDTQPKNKVALTVDYCFNIINISPLFFNSSLPRRLTIKLDIPLNKKDQEQLVIQAGDNHCTNITINEAFINCFMHLTTSGEFKINVSLRSDRYADAAVISAVSTDKVNILAPGRRHYAFVVILLLFSVSLIILSLLLACANYNNKYRNEFLVAKSSTNIMQMTSKNIRSALSSLSRSRSYSTWRSNSKIIVPKHPKFNSKLSKHLK
uniref:Sema domain-containing protein n=1 Tax=Tetranychus urticae TaxID=32264 RepID=A0A158P4V3_TETUR